MTELADWIAAYEHAYNLWVLRPAGDGRCREFTEWWTLHAEE